jgi:hypothetical protein
MFNKSLRLNAVILLTLAALALAPPARAQQQPTDDAQKPRQGQTTDAQATAETPAPAPQEQPAAQARPEAAQPLFRDFKGVTLGMSAEEARAKLGSPREKDKTQDFYVFSERERARVFYDAQGKVSAVIVTYVGKDSNAPAPSAVLGEEVLAKADGSIYHMVHYPEAGYWVAYSRTTGEEPLTIITMQKR